MSQNFYELTMHKAGSIEGRHTAKGLTLKCLTFSGFIWLNALRARLFEVMQDTCSPSVTKSNVTSTHHG